MPAVFFLETSTTGEASADSLPLQSDDTASAHPIAAMDEFVASHADAEVMENGKIRCTLTGHEVPPQLQTVQAYWTGKKYRNAKARREYDYSQHEPYLVPHTKSEHLLYCTLTKQPVRPSAALASVQ